jgi:hypothetical protein
VNKLISVAIIVAAAGRPALCQNSWKLEEKSSMKKVVNDLGAEITVTSKIRGREDLHVILSLTNESRSPFRLNAMELFMPSVRLRFFDGKGAPVPMGPPPLPRVDDGVSDRVVLSPDRPLVRTFSGTEIFGSQLDPGHYTVTFSYTNEPGHPGDWVGSIKTPPVEFEVIPPELAILTR